MVFVNLGRVEFREALARQEALVEAIASGREPETVLLLEHSPVFTVGRAGDSSNLLSAHDFDENPLKLVRINRGGDVTFHGPGQLVAYPHLDLRQRGRDVHRYLRQLEETLIRLAEDFEIRAFRREGLTGVWTDRGKLASLGVGVRRWITMHGLALNVSTDLRYFSLIHPCGIVDCRVTSLSELLGRHVGLGEVVPRFQHCFEGVFAGS